MLLCPSHRVPCCHVVRIEIPISNFAARWKMAMWTRPCVNCSFSQGCTLVKVLHSWTCTKVPSLYSGSAQRLPQCRSQFNRYAEVQVQRQRMRKLLIIFTRQNHYTLVELAQLLKASLGTVASVVASALHILKLERYREDQHGPCARMTRKFVKRSKFFLFPRWRVQECVNFFCYTNHSLFSCGFVFYFLFRSMSKLSRGD